MRIAVVTDIHGNLRALEAIIRDIATRGVDTTVNLGDIVSGPLFPRETAQLLMSLDWRTIRGNHERQVLEMRVEEMGASDRFAAENLGAAELTWLADLPSTGWLTDEVFLCHGTPRSDLEYYLEHVTSAGWMAATEEQVLDRTGDCHASLILCGHTHVPRLVRLCDGRTVVNPGSVGLQAFEDDQPHPHVIELGSPHARYAIAERKTTGWQVQVLAIPYDWGEAAQLASNRGRPDWAAALATGWLSPR
jgi:predicted phosphodiesterase